MNALVVALLAFAAASLSVALARNKAVAPRTLLVWLLPVLTSALAGGVYVLYEKRPMPAAPAGIIPGTLGVAMPPAGGRDLGNLGRPREIRPGENAQPASDAPVRDAGNLGELSKRLADKMERDPGNGQGWALLARSYANTQRFAEAEQTFAKAAKLLPGDAALLADWADAYVMAHERKWDRRAEELVQQALAADPKHLKALSLAASGANARGDYQTAAGFWAKMKAAAIPESAEAREAEANLARARSSGKGG